MGLLTPVEQEAQKTFGMVPMDERLSILPRYSSTQGLIAPQFIYDLAKAFVSPYVAMQGKQVTPEESLNVAMSAMGGSSIGSAPKGALRSGFLKDQGNIKPTGLLQKGQPFQSGIVDEKIGNSTVSYKLGDDGVLKIFSLRTPQSKRGQGSATEAMNQIVRRADEYGIPIKLDASPLDKKTSLNKLVDFYKKFGFEPTGEKVNILGEPVMMRTPNK